MKKWEFMAEGFKIYCLIGITFMCLFGLIRCQNNGDEHILLPIPVDSRYGYINELGKVVIKPQFNYARRFSDGLACISIGDRWGYIDKSGRYVINPQFDGADWW
ncbi:WG repeat-containing protein [Candidatus Poribacteria bacterium]|nr:WG repeat-containing protein [Candidatus Poribacteria bacterium]